MPKPITFCINDDTLLALDQLAKAMDRDRSYVINEAVGNYLEVKQWHAEQIQKAIAEADAREFATDAAVREAFQAFGPKS
jgi:predicted transcriptional regulator